MIFKPIYTKLNREVAGLGLYEKKNQDSGKISRKSYKGFVPVGLVYQFSLRALAGNVLDFMGLACFGGFIIMKPETRKKLKRRLGREE